jgi:hypothetical protein
MTSATAGDHGNQTHQPPEPAGLQGRERDSDDPWRHGDEHSVDAAGILTDREARKRNIGGEIVCTVW